MISKRNLRKVVKRQFRDIFHLILFNFQVKGNTGNESTLDQIAPIPKDDTLGGYINTTYYPDSLDR